MSLTRRHYVALAEALSTSKPATLDSSHALIAWWQWERDLETIARVLAADNPSFFDKPRFIAACRENMDKERTA